MKLPAHIVDHYRHVSYQGWSKSHSISYAWWKCLLVSLWCIHTWSSVLHRDAEKGQSAGCVQVKRSQLWLLMSSGNFVTVVKIPRHSKLRENRIDSDQPPVFLTGTNVSGRFLVLQHLNLFVCISCLPIWLLQLIGSNWVNRYDCKERESWQYDKLEREREKESASLGIALTYCQTMFIPLT